MTFDQDRELMTLNYAFERTAKQLRNHWRECAAAQRER